MNKTKWLISTPGGADVILQGADHEYACKLARVTADIGGIEVTLHKVVEVAVYQPSEAGLEELLTEAAAELKEPNR